MTPRDAYEQMRRRWLTDVPTFDAAMLAEDVVLETPFARPGRPTSQTGRDTVLAYVEAGHASVPFRFEDCRTLAIHDTTDPETIVVEYELTATMKTTGTSASAPFIGVLTVHDGRITRWREYQNTAAIEAAMSGR
ncbi:nuclear transport factor 2 family protein [Actinoplanes sp. NPDC051494]|uniref:nuclear transport factor 2 family protein n=1 Tax=Actinoplanes sp. NPDC051494 TaxID=3363907 RepID=UPI0037A78328